MEVRSFTLPYTSTRRPLRPRETMPFELFEFFLPTFLYFLDAPTTTGSGVPFDPLFLVAPNRHRKKFRFE